MVFVRREPHFEQQLIRSQGGCEVRDEEPMRRHAARPPRAADDDAAFQRGQHRRQLRRRISVRDVAANRPAGANLEMPHQRQCVGQQRKPSRDDRRALCRALPRHRADGDLAVLFADVVECFHAVEVDDHRRARQPHIQQRDQTLPAGEQLPLGPVGVQQCHGFLHGLRRRVLKRGRFHVPLTPLPGGEGPGEGMVPALWLLESFPTTGSG